DARRRRGRGFRQGGEDARPRVSRRTGARSPGPLGQPQATAAAPTVPGRARVQLQRPEDGAPLPPPRPRRVADRPVPGRPRGRPPGRWAQARRRRPVARLGAVSVRGWAVIFKGQRIQAEILQAILQADGLRAEVFGDTAYGVGIDLTEARLMVPDEDAETARQIIKEAEEAPSEEGAPEDV